MRQYQALWFLSMQVPSHVAALVAQHLEEDALSVSLLLPPRKNKAVIEALYHEEPHPSNVTGRLAILSTMFHFKMPHFKIWPAPNLDWLKKVAEAFPPLSIGRWTIHGAMHRHQVGGRLHALQIDATNAFGTGEHPTTRGCLLMLDKIIKKGFYLKSMADIGCGSGVLAMAFAQSVRGQVVAVDMDIDSILIAQKNARINGLGQKIHFKIGRGYAISLVRAKAPYDLIMANIFARPLCQMAGDLKNHLRLGGIAILSGLLTTQANAVIAAHRAQGMALIEHMKMGEWSVLALGRPHRA